MATDYFHDPLSYDEQVVAEKLGIYDYSPKPENDVNMNLRMALLQEELNTSKKRIASLQRAGQKSKRETFVGGVSGGCGCGGSTEGLCGKSTTPDKEDDIFGFGNKKLLLFLVIILAAFCVMQYISYRNETKEMLDMMCALLQNQVAAGQQKAPVQAAQVAAPVAPAQVVSQT